MWVQTRDGNPRAAFGSTVKKIGEQQTNADDLRLLECARNLAQWNMRRNERDSDFSARQTHREILRARSCQIHQRAGSDLQRQFGVCFWIDGKENQQATNRREQSPIA